MFIDTFLFSFFEINQLEIFALHNGDSLLND